MQHACYARSSACRLATRVPLTGMICIYQSAGVGVDLFGENDMSGLVLPCNFSGDII